MLGQIMPAWSTMTVTRFPDQWISVAQLAKQKGVPKRTLYHWIDSGKLPAFQVGNHWMIHIDDAALIEQAS